MKKFKFRLERVLQYRNVVKQEKLKALMEKNLELRFAQEKLEEMEKEYMNNKVPEGSVSVGQLFLHEAFSARIKESIARQKVSIEKIKEAVEAAHQEYLVANQEAEALEKVKERKRDEHAEQASKHDEKFLDELATQKGNSFSVETED
jgi:flagellar protein FliJ